MSGQLGIRPQEDSAVDQLLDADSGGGRDGGGPSSCPDHHELHRQCDGIKAVPGFEPRENLFGVGQ
ncbi:hypothetical protein BS330_28705 [Amycolatopsis keratiniphila subsp. nogabecina]|nr:hypothetical protein BS330_28705 [Amycolatopsis keratiniphila subsp. nogabecina]